MKSLLKYLKEYKIESILAPLFKMLEASFELFVPLVMAAIIDIGIQQKNNGYIFKMGGILIALAAIGLSCSIVAQYFSAKAAVGFATKLRHALFSHIQSFSFTEIDTIGNSTLITRMTSDVNQVQSGVNMTLRLFMRSPFVVFGAMIMAFTVDVKAALIFVVVIPLLSLIVFGIMVITIPLYKTVQMSLDKVLGKTRENLTGARVIRAFAQEDDEINAFCEENNKLMEIQVYVGKISAALNPLTVLIVNGGLIALIYIGAIRVNIGSISQGQVVALVNYMSQILIELIKLANLIVTITKALACAKRIEGIFQINNSMECGNDTKKTYHNSLNEVIVSFENVNLLYKNASEESLSNLNFKIKKGETIGIIGGTGSGKTSLVNLIPRYYDCTNGNIQIDGIDIKEYQIDKLQNKVGMVFQKAVLFKGTIRENLKWGKKNATDEEIWEALKIAQAEEFVKTKEGQLDFEIAQGGKNLSGGQKQRLTIARALVKKPEILILDDSASALDFATDAKLRKSIKEMKEKPTVFIVSQRTSSIIYADKIIVLDDGKIVGIGNHKELLEKCEEYQEIYYSQFPKEGAN